MKCDKCAACVVKTTPESYQEDFYCLCGVDDDDIFEKSDGNLGCNIHYTKVKEMIVGVKKCK
jgi:hypothetical protein